MESAVNEGAQTPQANPSDPAPRTAGFMVCLSGYPQSDVLPLSEAQELAHRLRRRHPHESLSFYDVESRIHFEWIA
jgi:hypothetical protein